MSDNRNMDPIEVTEENFGDLLIQGAKEALAYVRGNKSKARVRMRPKATPPAAALSTPPAYDAERIRALRVGLMLRQDDFAHALNVSDKTVKAWEQGISTPSGPSLRLLQIAEIHPEVLVAVTKRKVARA
jgi:DNA-binding transcriptional regulator YiaG